MTSSDHPYSHQPPTAFRAVSCMLWAIAGAKFAAHFVDWSMLPRWASRGYGGGAEALILIGLAAIIAGWLLAFFYTERSGAWRVWSAGIAILLV